MVFSRSFHRLDNGNKSPADFSKTVYRDLLALFSMADCPEFSSRAIFVSRACAKHRWARFSGSLHWFARCIHSVERQRICALNLLRRLESFDAALGV